jgi:AraC-like DNA-binding protein
MQVHTLLELAELFNYVANVPVWLKDRQCRYLWANQVVLRINSLNTRVRIAVLSDIVGKTDHELFPPFLADQYHRDDEYVLAGNRITNHIELVSQADGTATWHATTKIPLTDGQGTIIGTAGIARPLDPSSQDFPGVEFRPAFDYMRCHCNSHITNGQLARQVHMSVRAFERKFCQSFGFTPQTYLRQFRMSVASHAVIHTRAALAQIALDCGFADQSSFSREFRRCFGQTPRQYRQRYGSGLASAPIRSTP